MITPPTIHPSIQATSPHKSPPFEPPLSKAVKGVDPFDFNAAYLCITLTTLAFGLPYRDVFSRAKTDGQDVFIRQMAMYLLVTVRGFNATRVSRIFARDRTTVSYACGVIETQRDDPVFEQKLLALEDMLAAIDNSFNLAPSGDLHP